MSSKSYLIRLFAEGADSTRVWNTRRPFRIGHPVRWTLTQEEKGFRLISHDGSKSELIREKDLNQPRALPGASSLRIQLRAVESVPSAMAASVSGSALRVFHCRGEWSVDSFELHRDSIARFEGKKAIRFTGNASGVYAPSDLIRIKALIHDVVAVSPEGEKTLLSKGQFKSLSQAEASGWAFEVKGSCWKLAAFSKAERDPVLAVSPAADAEGQLFLKSLKRVAAGLAAVFLIALVWPKSEPEKKEEKIQIVLSPKKVKGLMTAAPKGDPSARDFSIGKSGSPKNAGRRGGRVAQQSSGRKQKAKVAAAAPKKSPSKPAARVAAQGTRKSNVASTSRRPAPVPRSELFKTFSSAAFRKASSGVLAGGITGSGSGSTSSASEARRMGSASGSGRNGLGSSDGVSTRSAQLYGVGGDGDGDGGPGSAGAGYGRGSHSKVSGQGRSFVALDTGASEVDEGLTRDQVGRVIHAHMNEIRYCYESAVLRDDGLEGRMTVDFAIGAPGHVQTARVGDSTVSSSRLHQCIVSRLRNWKFPKPKGGVTVAVSYPFMFKMTR